MVVLVERNKNDNCSSIVELLVCTPYAEKLLLTFGTWTSANDVHSDIIIFKKKQHYEKIVKQWCNDIELVDQSYQWEFSEEI